MVIDPVKVTARGDGLGLIKSNQATSFVITAPAADVPDLDVVITGISSSFCSCRSVCIRDGNGTKLEPNEQIQPN